MWNPLLPETRDLIRNKVTFPNVPSVFPGFYQPVLIDQSDKQEPRESTPRTIKYVQKLSRKCIARISALLCETQILNKSPNHSKCNDNFIMELLFPLYCEICRTINYMHVHYCVTYEIRVIPAINYYNSIHSFKRKILLSVLFLTNSHLNVFENSSHVFV